MVAPGIRRRLWDVGARQLDPDAGDSDVCHCCSSRPNERKRHIAVDTCGAAARGPQHRLPRVTCVRADVYEVANAVVTLTGEVHPLASVFHESLILVSGVPVGVLLSGGHGGGPTHGRGPPGCCRGAVLAQISGRGRAASRANAVMICSAQGQPLAMRSQVRRAVRAMRAGTCRSR